MAIEYVGHGRLRMKGADLTNKVLKGKVAILRPMGTELWVEVKKNDLIRQVQTHGQDLEVEVEFSGPVGQQEAYIEMWVPGLYR